MLRRSDYARDAKKAGEWLETYAKFFEPLALIPTIGPIASIFSKVFKNIGSATKSWSDLKANDLNAIRTELNELLRKQPHKIIIVRVCALTLRDIVPFGRNVVYAGAVIRNVVNFFRRTKNAKSIRRTKKTFRAG